MPVVNINDWEQIEHFLVDSFELLNPYISINSLILNVIDFNQISSLDVT